MNHRMAVLPTLAALAAAGTIAQAASAQQPTRVAVLPEPQGTVVGISVLVNAGSAWEAEQQAGVTHLAARTVLEAVRPQIEALDATADVSCERSLVGFTLVAPATTWRVAVDLFLEALFSEQVREASLRRARDQILRALEYERGNPEIEAGISLQGVLFGPDDRWARPACGRIDTIARLEAPEVESLMRARFRPERTAIGVAGPVDAAAARELLIRRLGEVDRPVLLPAPEYGTLPNTEAAERGTVTTWTGIAWPAAQGVDTEALRLLAHHLQTAVAPAPERPDVFRATAQIERHGPGSTLVLRLITDPERAAARVEHVLALMAETARQPLGPGSFEALTTRYRGGRFVELETPERRAEDAARRIFFGEAFRPVAERIDRLTPRDLAEAAAALGEPAILVLGPE